MGRISGVVALTAAVLSASCVGGAVRQERVQEGVIVQERVVEFEARGGFAAEGFATEGFEVVPLEPQAVPPAPGVFGKGEPGLRPPPFAVGTDLASIEVAPYAYCWEVDLAGPCVDGAADATRFVVATSDGVFTIGFEPGRELTATLADAGDDRPLDVVPAGDGRWSIELPVLDPGDYPVNLAWVGDLGDAHAVFTARVMPLG